MASHSDLDSQDPQRFVQGLARGLAVLRSFDGAHRRMKLADIAHRAGTNRAATRRSLLTLETLGYVRPIDGAYELTPKVLEFGWGYLSGDSLAELGRQCLDELTQRTGESSSLTVLDGLEILYLGRVHSQSFVRIDITAGARFPAGVTAMGRVLLAALPHTEMMRRLDRLDMQRLTRLTITDRDELLQELKTVAEQGWSYMDREFDMGLRSIAVPVTNASGETVAAINVGMPVVSDETITTEKVLALVAELRRTATSLGAAIGRSTPQM